MTAEESSASPGSEKVDSERDGLLQPLADASVPDQLAYSRSLFGNLIEWYKNADAKAQVILSLDGALLAFLTASIFTKRQDLQEIIRAFGAETVWPLLLMCAALLGSIACAIWCLWSRLYRRKERDRFLSAANNDEDADALAEIMWFFQFIAKQGPGVFRRRLRKVSGEVELLALSYQIEKLSEKVLSKHKLVNIGFLLTGISLLLLVVGAIGYIARAS